MEASHRNYARLFCDWNLRSEKLPSRCVKIPAVKSSALLQKTLLRYPSLLSLSTPIASAVEMICQCHLAGGQVLVCGNGGSAADAEHIVGELVKQFKLPRRISTADTKLLRDALGEATSTHIALHLQRGVRAISLVSQTSLTTAVANDTDASFIFAQQVYVYGRPGDVLIGISTSGNSSNVVKALQVGQAFGLSTLALTGAGNCALDACSDIILKAPSTETFEIQEFHLPIYHAICMMVEEELFGN